MPSLFHNKPASYITYTFTDKSSLSITVASDKKAASTAHRTIGDDIHTKRFQFDLSMAEFEVMIKQLAEVEENYIDFKESGKNFLICKNGRTWDNGKQTSQGYDIDAKDHNTLMAFVTKLKEANSQINTHLSDKLLNKVKQLEEHYEDTVKQHRGMGCST